MKKVLVALIFCFLVFSTHSFAQLAFGAKAGVNFAKFGGDDADLAGASLDSKTGFLAGAYLYYGFTDMFALQPELLYTMKGGEYSGPGGTATISLNYLEVPVVVKLNIPLQGSSINPFIYAGPSIAFKMSAESTVKPVGGGETTEDLKDIKGTDFSLAFGGGIGFPIGPLNTVGIDFRYALGLTSIDDSGADAEVTNNVISLTVFFGFH